MNSRIQEFNNSYLRTSPVEISVDMTPVVLPNTSNFLRIQDPQDLMISRVYMYMYRYIHEHVLTSVV